MSFYSPGNVSRARQTELPTLRFPSNPRTGPPLPYSGYTDPGPAGREEATVRSGLTWENRTLILSMYTSLLDL